MSEKIHIELGDVQKTLLLPLWGRSVETQKSNPLLTDHTAAEIIKKIDYDFLEAAKNLRNVSQLGWIARSLHIDTTIKRLLETYPAATMVNIGCGLDTTFDRMDNGRLTWYDVDLPDVIALRRKLIPERERRTSLAHSFLDHDWLSSLRIQEKVLFIAAGVLYYFEEHRIKDFLTRLAERFPGGEMVFDATTPAGVRTANRMVLKASGMDERSFLKWGLKDAKTLESWDGRIRLVREYPMFRDVIHRVRFKDRIMLRISDLFKIQYMVHIRFLGNA